ncbi:MAG: SprT-like domain-containing protein [Muribaculaceae bacterium]|nr:SprT-like domain-containing protein [Muribaculaceae bacterium]
MQFTLDFINTKFDEFNSHIFAGLLPKPPILLCDTKNTIGQCVSPIGPILAGQPRHSFFKLRFSLRFDMKQNELEDVIIHEMIHYFILLHGLTDSSPHGDIFKALMHSINAKHGRNISIRYKSQNGDTARIMDERKTWHVIAVMTASDGKSYIKVLPRVAERIVKFRNDVLKAQNIRSIDLYLHNNPFFNQYPVSAALRMYLLSKEEIDKNLAGARKLIVKGNSVTEA